MKRFIKTVPLWAFALVLVSIFVISVYLYARSLMPMSGATVIIENGAFINNYVKPGGPVDKAGIKSGDTLVSMNSMPMEEWEANSYIPKPGDTLLVGFLRNNLELRVPVVLASVLSYAPGFFWSIYIIMLLFSAGSLYILYKKPQDKAVALFFIYSQGFVITLNAQHLSGPLPIPMIASVIFLAAGVFLGPLLVHFHLLFPKPAKLITRFKKIPLLFYVTGALLFICLSTVYVYDWINGSFFDPLFRIMNRISLWWLTFTFIFALSIAIYQYYHIKDTLSRNQLRIVIIGAFFSCITPISLNLFYEEINAFNDKFPFLIPFCQGIGGLLMICCFLIAIFRYRIWNIEVILRKVLLYLGASATIIISYLLLLHLVNLLIIDESDISRFIILAVSIIIFLIMRDWLQRVIDRLFHRETYDSATVVAEFEEKLSGGYRIEDLGSRILDCIDEIFHFRSFVLCLKEDSFSYNPAFSIRPHQENISGKFTINQDFEKKLIKSNVFSVAELNEKPDYIDMSEGELIVPMIKGNELFGFFLCGHKKSEKTYSIQDILVLSLIAKRVIALFQTAALYQKDLDRQLMLERERARISQDMHDDVGASLTRITILSDLAKNKADVTGETQHWLGQISDTSRNVMEEMGQIIWALNPKNDTLEGLVAYLRRYANEYLEPTTINCTFDFPDILLVRALTVEARRNVYLVVREALHNVVKHSGATRVGLTLKIEVSKFMISIRDDGKGFDPGKLEFPGNGLINMKKRMNDIGGEITIRSESGSGAEIELIVSLK